MFEKSISEHLVELGIHQNALKKKKKTDGAVWLCWFDLLALLFAHANHSFLDAVLSEPGTSSFLPSLEGECRKRRKVRRRKVRRRIE